MPFALRQRKLEVEKTARQLGMWTIRPGLVFGDSSGAMFGKLVANIRRSTLLPMPGAGNQPMFLVHEADLADAVLRCLDTSRPYNSSPVTVAHERMWPFKDMMHEIARRMNRKVTLLPIPWRMIWLGLRTAEKLNAPLGLRSDKSCQPHVSKRQSQSECRGCARLEMPPVWCRLTQSLHQLMNFRRERVRLHCWSP